MRTLVCLDPQPNPDPAVCTQTAWIDQASVRDFLPTVEQANEVGVVMFTGLMILAVARKLLFPPSERAIQ